MTLSINIVGAVLIIKGDPTPFFKIVAGCGLFPVLNAFCRTPFDPTSSPTILSVQCDTVEQLPFPLMHFSKKELTIGTPETPASEVAVREIIARFSSNYDDAMTFYGIPDSEDVEYLVVHSDCTPGTLVSLLKCIYHKVGTDHYIQNIKVSSHPTADVKNLKDFMSILCRSTHSVPIRSLVFEDCPHITAEKILEYDLSKAILVNLLDIKCRKKAVFGVTNASGMLVFAKKVTELCPFPCPKYGRLRTDPKNDVLKPGDDYTAGIFEKGFMMLEHQAQAQAQAQAKADAYAREYARTRSSNNMNPMGFYTNPAQSMFYECGDEIDVHCVNSLDCGDAFSAPMEV